MFLSLDFKQPGAEQIVFPMISLIRACMDVRCMYRQYICQATYVLYSCDMCVISYMCGTMAYGSYVSARWSNYLRTERTT